MKAGEQAPHGRGEATVVDTAVRDSQRILAKNLSFDNPAWARKVQRLVNDEVKKGLGVAASNVKAELHNLLIYSKGGHFSRHRDSEKCPGMFGTLIVSLPCAHQGGTLIMQHGGKEHRFETATSTPCCIQWCAFYADVQHEVQPILSGYRVVLVYNLVGVGGSGVPRPPQPPVVTMKQVADSWKRDDGKVVVHMLKHAYTEDGIDWDQLKGADARAVSALRACGDFDLQLAIVKKIEECDAGIDDPYEFADWQMSGRPNVEIYESYFEIVGKAKFLAGGLPNIEKEEVGKNLYHFDRDTLPEFLLQGEEFFSDRGPDDEECEGPTGNAGCPITRWYRAGAVIIRPKRLRLAALGREQCRRYLVDAVNGNRDSLLGFPTPQLLYNNWVASEGGLHDFCNGSSSEDISDVLRVLGHKAQCLSAKCAREFLHALPASSVSVSLCSGLHAVVRRYWKHNGSWWLQQELLDIFVRTVGSRVDESAVVRACDLMTALFSHHDTIPDIAASNPWTSLHARTAKVVVSSLARSALPISPSRFASHVWPAARTVVAVLSALNAPSNPLSVRSQLPTAVRLIANNTARFDPFHVLPDALELLGATSLVPSNAAISTDDSVGKEDCRFQYCDTLIKSVINSFAARSTVEPLPVSYKIANALQCAIHADAVDRWAPLSKIFDPHSLVSALADLFTSSWEGRSKCLSKFWTTWSQCLCDLMSLLLATADIWSSGPILRLFEIAMALDSAASKTDTTVQLAQLVVSKTPVQPFIIHLVKKMVWPPNGKQCISPGVVHLVRHCTDEIARRLNDIPALPQRHVTTLKAAETMSLSSFPSEVQTFFQSTSRSRTFCGRLYTYDSDHTCALQRLGSHTGLFTIERLSSKKAFVNGRLQVTKSIELHEAQLAQDSRRKQVNPLECHEKLLRRVTQKLPVEHRSGILASPTKRSTSTASLPSSIVKRAKSEQSHSQSSNPSQQVEPSASIVDLT